MGEKKLLAALSLVRFCIDLAFFLVHIIAVSSIVTLYTVVCHLLKREECMRLEKASSRKYQQLVGMSFFGMLWG